MYLMNKTYKLIYICAFLSLILFFSFSFDLCLANNENKSDLTYQHLKTRAEYYKKQFISFTKALRENDISVPSSFKNNMMLLLQEHAKDFITIKTSKEGLKWNISGIVFIREDLIFAQYDDGEMEGGELLLKITYEKENNSINTIVLWNSALYVQ